MIPVQHPLPTTRKDNKRQSILPTDGLALRPGRVVEQPWPLPGFQGESWGFSDSYGLAVQKLYLNLTGLKNCPGILWKNVIE